MISTKIKMFTYNNLSDGNHYIGKYGLMWKVFYPCEMKSTEIFFGDVMYDGDLKTGIFIDVIRFLEQG